MCTWKKKQNCGQAPTSYSATALSSSDSNNNSFKNAKFYSSSSFSSGFVHLSSPISFQKLRKGVAFRQRINLDAFTIIALFQLIPSSMAWHAKIELWEPIVSKCHFSSGILWQISDRQYFFAFDQTHTTAERRLTFLGGSASNSISEVSPYNEVWQTRSQVTSLFGREPFALNLRHVYLAASSLARLECNRAWHAWTRECHPHCNALHIMASPYLVRWELSARITVPCGL